MSGQAPGHAGSILVVDDEESIREICRRILADRGYDVVTAPDGDDAVSRLDAHEFDVVLSDISMPGTRSGVSLLEIIKQKSPHTDVIMMTGFPSLSTAIPTLKNGAYDYLVKPFENSVLASVVDRCFEKRRLSGELDREKLLRLELKAAYSELQKVEKLKESFLSRLSHELRTPFISVFFVLDQIESGTVGDPITPIVKTLRTRISEVWELVENMLLFADLRHEDVSSYRVPIEPKVMLKDILQRFRIESEKKELSVELSVDPAVESFEGDPQLMATAFKHLFLNAIHFNRKGGRIQIDVKSQGDSLLFVFSDTGIGIPSDKLPGIFDSFYQVAEYMTREVGGLGLGLAIVRRIVEAHGGTVKVISAAEKGSQFYVTLPKGQRGATHA